MNKRKISELLEDLSVAEQIELVQDIWDTIAESSEMPELTDEEKKELNRRSSALRQDPSSGISWENIQKL